MRKPVLVVGGVALVTLVAGVAVAASASAGTVTYEAEASANIRTGSAHTLDCRRCSDGSRVGGIGGDGALQFVGVTAEHTGSTKIAVTYTSPEARTAQISINGSVPTAIEFPATRGAERPGTLKVPVTLQSGANILAFGNPAGAAPDLDKIVITTDGTPPLPAPTGTTPGGPAATATVDPGAPVPPGDPASGSVIPPSGAVPSGATPPPPPGNPSPPAQEPTAQPPSNQPPAQPSGTRTPTGTSSPKPTRTPTAQASTAAATGDTALETAVVTLVNEERSAAGCRALTTDAKLTAAARAHSADMAARGYFSHTTPEGVQFSTRITDAGYRWSGAGENIAKGQRTAREVMTGWMNSAGHKANILNCSFTDIGVGVVADAKGSLVWTQDFARPR
ncbi:MAG TPA: CAP domain-containing protein [Actinoplanes sp.]|jgi:uncharacterized protein YkwD